MIKLRVELNKLLKEIHPRVYFMKAPDTASFPYIVYDLPQSFTDGDIEVFNLDIDIWDDNTDTTELESLANTIWKALDNYYFINEDIQFSVYRQSRHTVEDDDPRIRRRTLLFNLRYCDRRVN